MAELEDNVDSTVDLHDLSRHRSGVSWDRGGTDVCQASEMSLPVDLTL